jgi:hypothetical protein
MTVCKFVASPVYYQRVLRPTPVTSITSIGRDRSESRSATKKRKATHWTWDWIVPVLTLIGTAAAMWFVVTEGWFQLFGFWGM